MGPLENPPADHPAHPLLVFPAQSLSDLESQRPYLVRAILSARVACENANKIAEPALQQAEEAQQLLSATVRALEDLDNQLDRRRSAPVSPGAPLRSMEAGSGMEHKSRITTEDPFPEDLALLDDTALEVLNSRN